MLLGVTCIFLFLILKFLNRLKCFWLSIQVTNRLYCFSVCSFCHPWTIWNFCDFSWRLKLSGVNCTEFRFHRPFLLSCAQRHYLKAWVDKSTIFSDLYEIVYLTLNLISLCLPTGVEHGKGLLSLPPLLKNTRVNISWSINFFCNCLLIKSTIIRHVAEIFINTTVILWCALSLLNILKREHVVSFI